MPAFLTYKYNPNVISKFLAIVILGITVMNQLNDLFGWGIVLFYSFLYFLNKDFRAGVKNLVVYGIIYIFVKNVDFTETHLFFKMFVMIIITIKFFYLPFMAGKFFLKTSDVGSIISAMDCAKIPICFSIPIAVIFRFFPSFQEEKQYIKMAMKIRGVTPRNPLKYLEYVGIPLLMVSSNITDDIAKAAETKCIANPVKKTRYREVDFGWIDAIFICIVILLLVGGLVW